MFLEWGVLHKTKTWDNPLAWEKQASKEGLYYRVFTNSLSDFFHHRADTWRPKAWSIIKNTPHLIHLILTKRPELITKRLPCDWGDGYPNVWLGVSTGCRMTLNKMDSLRKIPCALRFVSMEPLLEDIADEIDLSGFGWGIVGGESGSDPEYKWNPQGDWKLELKQQQGRRTMDIEWANGLWKRFVLAGKPFFFKQTTAPRPGCGEHALGRIVQEFPNAPGPWAKKEVA